MKQFVGLRGAGTATLVMAAGFLVFTCGAAGAGALDNWRFDNGADGAVTASLYANNKLITAGGAISYSPVLTIACRSDGEPRWSERLQLNDGVSASRTITMSVAVDQGHKVSETWSVGPRGKTLVRDGADGVKRLATASRLLLSWRFGLLSGRGEADFDLGGVGEAVGRLAGDCNTSPP